MITIKQNKKCDTRTCDVNEVSKYELLENSRTHIEDVRKGLYFFAHALIEAGKEHDYTKLTDIDGFYRDFKVKFETHDWWDKHRQEERHHLKDAEYIQDDVNLIDILEMITDGVMAGLARTGEYRKEEISDKLLRKAFDNTIKLLLANVELKK